MTEKRQILIVSENDTDKESLAFERAVKFISNNKYNITKKSFNNTDSSKLPDLLVILDTSPDASSYSKGVHYLRQYWAKLIQKGKDSPSVIFISNYNLQELLRNDLKHYVLCSQGVHIVTIPFSLAKTIDLIQNNIDRQIIIEEVRKYLTLSCELGQQLTHDLRNFECPYSLLFGSRFEGELTDDTVFLEAIEYLSKRNPSEELKIYHTAKYKEFDSWDEGGLMKMGDVGGFF